MSAHERVLSETCAALAASETERARTGEELVELARDYESQRRRTERELKHADLEARAKLIAEILPVLDDLERALEAAAIHDEAGLEDGVVLIERKLRLALAREGVSMIPVDGGFDPHLHEALVAEDSELDEGTILRVVESGYRIGERIVRPARVVVAVSPLDENEQAGAGALPDEREHGAPDQSSGLSPAGELGREEESFGPTAIARIADEDSHPPESEPAPSPGSQVAAESGVDA